ncbi:MAG: DUF2442 domain-containing protein [Muribaculaceae bacterium]|nr:DUF2442 domain-containing protein [Muribaculaceae bacterium]
MYIKVTDVEYRGQYRLCCTFNDGSVKIIDMSPVLDAPAFRELRDIDKFRQFGFDETVFWANGADIAPEWLYSNGVPSQD